MQRKSSEDAENDQFCRQSMIGLCYIPSAKNLNNLSTSRKDLFLFANSGNSTKSLFSCSTTRTGNEFAVDSKSKNKASQILLHNKQCNGNINSVEKTKTFNDWLSRSSVTLYVEGPFGSAMEDIHKYKISLCVAGGIGITPFASVLNQFL